MGNDNVQTRLFGHLDGVECLSHCSYWVEFDQNCICRLLPNSDLDPLRVCNVEVIPDNLDSVSKLPSDLGKVVEVVFIKWILQGPYRVCPDQFLIVILQLTAVEFLPVDLVGGVFVVVEAR